MENRIYNWGIVGLGKIAKKFASDLKSVENANLYAVASRSKKKAESFATEFKAENFYGSYEALAEDPKIDVVYIATPHVFHHDNTLLFLRNKKAVLCEKPFAINKAQVLEMMQVAKEKNVFLMEALWTYFLPHYQEVLRIVHSGKYGKIKSLEANFGFKAPKDPEKRLFNKKLGGGSLLDIGIYPVFAALSLLGRPDTIEANAKIGKTGVDENCEMELIYKNGPTASLSSSIIQKTPTVAHIEMEKASILINTRFHEPSSFVLKTKEDEQFFNYEVGTHGYNFEAAHVLQMLNENRKESTLMTFEKSIELIGILDEIREKIGLAY